MWQPRWHQSENLHSLFHQQMAMPELVCDGSATSLDARHTGHIPFSGLWPAHCRNLLLMLGACGSAWVLERGDSAKIPQRRNRYRRMLGSAV